MDSNHIYINREVSRGFNPQNKHLKLNQLLLLPVLLIAALSTFLISNGFIKNNSVTESKAAPAQNSYDVIVAGAGTGGISAAIQAARAGVTVLLIEETDYVGGQMTAAGVTSMDGTGTGLYSEFVNRIQSYYSNRGLSIGKCNFRNNSTCFESHVGQQILKDMINEYPNITLSLRTKVKEVKKDGDKVSSVVLSLNNQDVKTKVLIDATEYGDVIPLTGANYRIGNGTNTSPKTNACIQDITYPAHIKYYPAGVPEDIKIKTPPPGYNATLVSKFARILDKNSTATKFEGSYPTSFLVHNWYRGIPNSSISNDTTDPTKTSLNWLNDYPATQPYIDYSDGIVLSTRYLEDINYRKQINCEAKLKTIQVLYYIQNELNQPNWGISLDENYDTDYNTQENSCPNIPEDLKSIERNMPVIPYVRESRRIIGLTTVTAKDIKREGNPAKAAKSYASSIAVGTYPIDLHNCTSDTYLESELESSSDSSSISGPFQVPVEALISNNVSNLIAAEKNISFSRLASGAVRLQPITMLTGQAAGALAALSVKQNVNPAQVKVIDVQKVLLKSKSVLVPYTDFNESHPYFYDMQLISLRGIMIGYSILNFGASDSINRGQASVLITRSFGYKPISTSVPTFTDVPLSNIYNQYIESMYKNGFTSGCLANPKKFCPNDPITNAQLAVFAQKGWSTLNPSIGMFAPRTQTYTDVPPTHWAYKQIETLAANGVKVYCNVAAKKFCPDDKGVNRATASHVINSILDKENK